MDKTMNLALFARANHPEGYYRHGYSLIIVSYEDDEQLNETVKFLQLNDTKMPFTRDDGPHEKWYGGRFDLVATLDGTIKKIGSQYCQPNFPRTWTNNKGHHSHPDFFLASTDVSLGDNRHIAYYSAEEILNQKYSDRPGEENNG